MKTIQINNKHYKKCDVVMLETTKTNNLNDIVLNPERTRLATLNPLTIDSKQPCTNQHLYILSNDEIKEGDWYIDDTFTIRQSVTSDKEYWSVRTDYKKVIATTDSSLQFAIDKSPYPMEIHLLPQIPQQFIEYFISEYNKNNVISKVLVEVEHSSKNSTVNLLCNDGNFKIKLNQNNEISILTEQEKSLEAAAEYYAHNYFNMHETNNYIALKQGFKVGAKSDAARDYWFKIFKDKFIDNSNDK
jgi:hypothetical protein